jgi:hypothetical protein
VSIRAPDRWGVRPPAPSRPWPRRIPRPAWNDTDSPPVKTPNDIALEILEGAVRSASCLSDPRDALRAIDAIWSQIDEVSTLAESRMRILLKRVERPVLAESPEWLAPVLEALKETGDPDLGPPHPTAVESARRLVLATLAEVQGSRKASLEPSPGGSVAVTWPRGLRWLVALPRLPWPGVNVRVYTGSDATDLEARTYHQAFGVIEASRDELRRRG